MQIDLNQIISLIDNGNISKAELLGLEFYNQNQSNYMANKAMGVIYLLQKKLRKSIKFFNECHRQKEDDFDVLLNLSHIYSEMFDIEKSEFYGQKAQAINKSDPRPLINMVENKIQMGCFSEAFDLICETINLYGGLETMARNRQNENILIKYLDIIFVLKEKKFVLEELNKILNQDFNPNIFYYWANYDSDSIPQILINIALGKISENYPNQIIRSKALISIYFGLALVNKPNQKVMENYYLLANQCASKLLIYNAVKDQQRIKNIKRLFEQVEVKGYTNSDPSLGQGLIFIVGMPRSGTTLTESIVSIADNTVSAGETTVMLHLCQEYYISSTKNFLTPDFETIGSEYLRVLNNLTKKSKFKIDKLPGNFIHLGFITKSLPSAKIIHVKRDPWDNAISLFQQQYLANIPYSSDFLNIAVHYANYEHTMNYWKNAGLLNQKNFIEINYEDLVKNNEKTASALYSFCGLKGIYDPGKRKTHFARTASKNQVNKPIYSSSLKKSFFSDFKEKFYSDLELQREYWGKYS